jgi:hypothetical protein
VIGEPVRLTQERSSVLRDENHSAETAIGDRLGNGLID